MEYLKPRERKKTKNNLKLITKVQTFPELYERTHISFSNEALRKQSWTKVAKSIKSNAGETRRQFNQIRDSYVRYRKKKLQGEEVFLKMSREIIFEALTFLDPFIQHRNRSSKSNPDKKPKKAQLKPKPKPKKIQPKPKRKQIQPKPKRKEIQPKPKPSMSPGIKYDFSENCTSSLNFRKEWSSLFKDSELVDFSNCGVLSTDVFIDDIKCDESFSIMYNSSDIIDFDL